MYMYTSYTQMRTYMYAGNLCTWMPCGITTKCVTDNLVACSPSMHGLHTMYTTDAALADEALYNW